MGERSGTVLRFGTDGVRGVAGVELTPELTLALGRAVGRVLGPPAGPAQLVVGRDTRQSGTALQAALSAGLAGEGVEVLDAGVIPTPGVAHLAAERRCPGAVVSASHNPYFDNGVKVFAAGGTKLDPAIEAAIEAEWDRASSAPAVVGGGGVGRIVADPLAARAYTSHLLAALGGRRLEGLFVVLDCANGAASAIAPDAFSAAGARLRVIGAEPDGTNINDGCGSTQLGTLRETVLASGADLGLAFDGDADRCLAVAGAGELVDGDHLVALFAADLASRGELDGRAVAVSVMSNLGLRLAMQAAGITVVETAVGDRHVLDAMTAGGLVLGGEQSGHLIFRRLATTGDGILTGLLLTDLVCRRRSSLAELAAKAMTRLPQHLANVSLPPGRRNLLVSSPRLAAAVAAAQADLGPQGRVLLRPSGTEPLVRVMVEAPTPAGAVAAVEALCTVLRDELA